MKNITSPRRSPRIATLALASSLCLAGAASVHAQQFLTPLPTTPNLTELQQPIANAIDFVCPKLPAPDPRGTPIQRLSYSCSAMVVTSFVQQNGRNPPFDPNGTLDLRIGNEQLRTLVQASGPVQMNAQKQLTTTSSRMNLLVGRLFDLRGGARGFSVSMNDVAAPQRSASAADARGGGASADFGGRLGGFVKLAGNWGNVDRTDLQDPYDYDSWSILAGADYRVTDAFVIGGAVSYEDTRSRFDNSLGKVDATTWSFSGYGTYTAGPWYVDGFVSYGHIEYDTTRTIFIPSNNPAAPSLTGNATASPNGDQWSLSVGTGYNYQLTGYTLIPFARLGYIHVKNKSFSENESVTGLGLSVGDRTLESLQSALGATISTTLNTSSGVFTPYFTAQWMHEFKNDNPSINAKFVNDPNNFNFFIPTADPTRDYAVFIVGSGATLPNGFSGFLQFGAAAGLRDASNYSVVAGVRKEF